MVGLTKNDFFRMEDVEWEITPYNYLPIDVSPPKLNDNFILFQDHETDSSLRFELVVSEGWRHIDPDTHELLLNRSLLEHEVIWRALAER